MATAVIVTDLSTNLITACDNLTADGTWSGVTVGLGSTDPLPLEGSGRTDFIVKSTTDSQNDIYFAPTSSQNVSGEHLRLMLYTALKAVLKNISANAIDIILSDGTNTAYYSVSGADVYIGGWETLVLDTGATPWSGTAPSMSAITSIGIIFRLNTSAKNVDTVWLDYITFGDGFQSIYGGTSGDEIAFSHIDTQDVYYKIFEQIAGIYRVRGELVFGDNSSTNVTWFKDPGTVVFFDDLVVSTGLYKIKSNGNATGVTHLDFSGIFFGSAGERYLVDLTDTNLTSATLDGTTFQHANDINLGSNVSGDGTIFDDCDAIDPGGASLDSCTIKNTNEASTGSLLVNTQAEAEACDNITFLNYGSNYAVYVAASVTTFEMDNWQFDNPNGTGGNIALHWLGTSGTLTVSAANGTNLVTAGCSAETGGAVTVTASVSITITVQDESKTVIVGAQVSMWYESVVGGGYDTQIMNEDTIAGGIATESWTGTTPLEALLKVRKSEDTDDPRYYGFSDIVTIAAGTGLTRTVTLEENPHI